MDDIYVYSTKYRVPCLFKVYLSDYLLASDISYGFCSLLYPDKETLGQAYSIEIGSFYVYRGKVYSNYLESVIELRLKEQINSVLSRIIPNKISMTDYLLGINALVSRYKEAYQQ